MNTQTLKTLRTGSLIHVPVCLPLGHKICLSCRHKSVPKFILVSYDVDENHISTLTDEKPASRFGN